MKHRVALLGALCATLAASFAAGSESDIARRPAAALEGEFDAAIDADEMRDWLRQMASEPNHVGSPHDRANAEWELTQFSKFGWNAHIETFDVLYPTPVSETLELRGNPVYRATLQEPPLAGDTSAVAKDAVLPAYLAYQGDGDVSAPLVYVNYGMPDDYKALQRLGISVAGKIVIARYGGGFRGLKPRLAQEHGAIGCLIYSDPADDGYAVESPYPEGPSRPSAGIQRGSVIDVTLYGGDALASGDGVNSKTRRLTVQESPVIMKIPALPLSYADAQVFLSRLGGPVAPPDWRGALPITYRVGPSADLVHLAVRSDWSIKRIYDVIAVMKGSVAPEEWVLRGNHRDGWVFGAADPLSGQVAMLEEAKAIGRLASHGWRPKRSIVYLSWDGEEPGLLGSTEWVEAHAAELAQKAVIYINSDNNDRGFLSAGGNHDWEHFVNEVADDVTDPETHTSVAQRLRAKMAVDAITKGAGEETKANGKIALDPAKDFPIHALGSGSDYSAFMEHLGIPSLNIGYGEAGPSRGVYHSRYDTFEHFAKFGDPGFRYTALLSKTAGRLVLRAADADVPQQLAGNFADTVGRYLDEAKKLETDKRSAAAMQAKLLAANAFGLAADPRFPHDPPTPLAAVPPIDLKPMDEAVQRLKSTAEAYDTAYAANASHLSAAERAHLSQLMRSIDQTLAPPVGLPGRGWFKNLIYAPGRYTGYGAKPLPGITEAIEEERWTDADRYAAYTADALNAYSARLDEATAVLRSAEH